MAIFTSTNTAIRKKIYDLLNARLIMFRKLVDQELAPLREFVGLSDEKIKR